MGREARYQKAELDRYLRPPQTRQGIRFLADLRVPSNSSSLQVSKGQLCVVSLAHTFTVSQHRQSVKHALVSKLEGSVGHGVPAKGTLSHLMVKR